MQRRRTLIKTLGLAALVLPLTGFMFLEKALAPKADLWPHWQAFDAASNVVIDHGPWDRFLKTYVTKGPGGVNRVPYGRVGKADRTGLERYLDGLKAAPVSRLNRNEQRAFWINLYNALTVQVILQSYPLASIRDLDDPWDRKRFEIDGKTLSLNDIEHRILRPIWRDPRIHYAVNCASIGCPDLQPVAFTAANGETLLDLGARNYVNHRRGARVEDGGLIVSKIYAWFTEDFGGSEESVIAHLRRLAKPALAKKLDGITAIEDYEYDWRLNDAGS